MTAGLSDSAVSGPAAAALLARGICRALDQLGYASLAVNGYIKGLRLIFPAFPNVFPNPMTARRGSAQ